jgi:hypothetical protein
VRARQSDTFVRVPILSFLARYLKSLSLTEKPAVSVHPRHVPARGGPTDGGGGEFCHGGNITNFVNGHVGNVATQSRLRKGKLLFQSEGAEIFYRRIELTPLKKRG